MDNSRNRLVEILDINYEPRTNLFRVKVVDKETKNEIILAIPGEDWNIKPQVVPLEIINNFCNDTIGKEKNLLIKVDYETLASYKGNEKIEDSVIKGINKNMDKYPINQIMNTLYLEEEQGQ